MPAAKRDIDKGINQGIFLCHTHFLFICEEADRIHPFYSCHNSFVLLESQVEYITTHSTARFFWVVLWMIQSIKELFNKDIVFFYSL